MKGDRYRVLEIIANKIILCTTILSTVVYLKKKIRDSSFPNELSRHFTRNNLKQSTRNSFDQQARLKLHFCWSGMGVRLLGFEGLKCPRETINYAK